MSIPYAISTLSDAACFSSLIRSFRGLRYPRISPRRAGLNRVRGLAPHRRLIGERDYAQGECELVGRYFYPIEVSRKEGDST